MAIFHLSVKSGSRSAGQSAGAHGEYIAREGKYASKATDELAVHVEHGNLPDFAESNAHTFWRAADSNERANGRLWTELEVSIPRELSREEQLALARDFRQEVLGDRHAFSLAIHVPKTMDGKNENPHMHLMFSERVIDERTKKLDDKTYFKRNGATKDRSWNEQTKVEEVRALWEDMANKALEQAGSTQRIDRRSLAAQGLDHAPEPKIGKSAPEVRRVLALVQSGKNVGNLSERAQTALQVRALRTISLERRGVVIELAKVREERAQKATERTQRLKRYDALPLSGLRNEARSLEPARAESDRPVWEKEWSKLPQVVAAIKSVNDAETAIGRARGVTAETERRMQRASEAEQAYKKAHWFRAGLHAVGMKDGKLGELTAQRVALEKEAAAGAQQMKHAEASKADADQAWKAIQTNPELQAHAQEIHGDKVEQWKDAKQVLERREGERKQAETLTDQLAAAHRLGGRFDRERVPETVRGMLVNFDLAKSEPGGVAKAKARMTDTLTTQAELRQIVTKALAPQMKAIDQELGNEAGRGGGYGR